MPYQEKKKKKKKLIVKVHPFFFKQRETVVLKMEDLWNWYATYLQMFFWNSCFSFRFGYFKYLFCPIQNNLFQIYQILRWWSSGCGSCHPHWFWRLFQACFQEVTTIFWKSNYKQKYFSRRTNIKCWWNSNIYNCFRFFKIIFLKWWTVQFLSLMAVVYYLIW